MHCTHCIASRHSQLLCGSPPRQPGGGGGGPPLGEGGGGGGGGRAPAHESIDRALKKVWQ